MIYMGAALGHDYDSGTWKVCKDKTYACASADTTLDVPENINFIPRWA